MAFADPGDGRKILDSGRGTQPGEVTLAEACKLGDVLGYSSGWKRALATTGATPGGYVYVAEGTDNGEITQTAPSTSGDADTISGIALSATEVMFFLNSRADSTAA